MSGECDRCAEHALDCVCKNCPNSVRIKEKCPNCEEMLYAINRMKELIFSLHKLAYNDIKPKKIWDEN